MWQCHQPNDAATCDPQGLMPPPRMGRKCMPWDQDMCDKEWVHQCRALCQVGSQFLPLLEAAASPQRQECPADGLTFVACIQHGALFSLQEAQH